MDILYRPSVPDTYDHWQVFNDDEQVEIFLTSEGEDIDNKVDWKGLNEVFEVKYLRWSYNIQNIWTPWNESLIDMTCKGKRLKKPNPTNMWRLTFSLRLVPK